MSTLFTELQAEQEKQRKLATQPGQPPAQPRPPRQKPAVTQKPTQKVTQVSNLPSTQMSNPLSKPPDTEAIEDLAYALRKTPKVRVNADVPLEWKEQLDNLAHTLKVGKYELLLYVIAWFLGHVEADPAG